MSSPAPNPLSQLLSDTRLPSAEPAHSGGAEEAIRSGLVTGAERLTAFLHGRLLTIGTSAAFAAAAVCARAAHGTLADSVLRSFEAEIDARILSPAARATSRQQGAALLRRAMSTAPGPLLGSLARYSLKGEGLHHPVVIGAVAAVAGAAPQDAAAAAAHASVAGSLHAGRELLALSPKEFTDMTAGLENGINRLAVEAGRFALLSVSEIPAWIAPGLEFLAEEHARRERRSFAS